MPQSYARNASKAGVATNLTRVERTIDEALAFWMQEVKPEGAQGTSDSPEKVFMHPAGWWDARVRT